MPFDKFTLQYFLLTKHATLVYDFLNLKQPLCKVKSALEHMKCPCKRIMMHLLTTTKDAHGLTY